MSIKTEIEQAIENALNDLSIVIALDEDNDLEVTLFLGKKELSQSYVELDKVFLKIEP